MPSSRASTFGWPSSASQASLRPVPKTRFAEFIRRLRPRHSRPDDLESQSTNTAPFSLFSSNTGNSLQLSNLTTAPSTAPTSASIAASNTSPHQAASHGIYSYGGLYVHPQQPIDLLLQRKWDKILNRLMINMVHASCGRFNASISFVSKTQDVEPTRTVLVTCADDEQRRRVESHCKALDWFQKFVSDNGLAPVQYVLCPNAKPTACADRVMSHGMDVIGSCSLLLPHSYDSLCGLPLTMAGAEGLSSKRCTVGGIVACNNNLYAWTTRHSFDPPENKAPGSRWRRSARKMSSLLLRAPSTKQQVILHALLNKSGSLDDDQGADLDYVLLDLTKATPDLTRRLLVPNKIAGRAIHGSLPVYERACDAVSITTATAGTFHGTLCGTPQLVVSGASVHKAYLIVLDRMMVAGCSGAWVVQDGYVLGYLVSARDDLPWAYMISMEEALEDVTLALGHPARVATQDELDCFFARGSNPPTAQEVAIIGSMKQDDPSLTTLAVPGCHPALEQTSSHNGYQQHQLKSCSRRLPSKNHSSPEDSSSKDSTSAFDRAKVDKSTLNLTGSLRDRKTTTDGRQNSHIRVFEPGQSSSSLLNRVKCRLVVRYMGGTHECEYELDLNYLKSKSAFFAVCQIAEETRVEQLSPRSANHEVYLVSLSCALIEEEPSHIFDLVSKTSEQDWVDDVSSMLDAYYSQRLMRNLSFELQFNFGGYLKSNNATESARGLLKQQLSGQIRSNFLLNPYIPQEALSTIITGPLGFKLVREVFRETKSSIYLQSAMHHFVRRAQRLLAICLLTDTPDSAIRGLYENGIEDADLPLDASMVQNTALSTIPPAFMTRQWECMACQFDLKSSEERPWALPRGQHLSLRPELIMPIHRKGDLGFGPFVQVWRVRVDSEQHDLASSRETKFALKVILGISDTGEDTFKPESQTLRAIEKTRHPHILTSLASWSHRSSFYQLLPLAMHNLRMHVDKIPPPTLNKESTLWFLNQVRGLSDAIRFIHQKSDPKSITPDSSGNSSDKFDKMGMGYHHDLKPSNILVFHQQDDSLPMWKIADFGIARIKQMRTGISTSGGDRDRIYYKAPDTVSNGHVSRAHDIWSIGCILAEVITWVLNDDSLSNKIERDILEDGSSRAAFWDRNDQNVLRVRPSVTNHLQRLRNVSAGRGVFPRCIRLTERMLTVEPGRRPTASVVMKEWDMILEQATADLSDEDFYLRGSDKKQPDALDQSPGSSTIEDDVISESSSGESNNLTEQGTVLWSAPSTADHDTCASTVSALLNINNADQLPTTFIAEDGLSDTTSSRTTSDSLFEAPSSVSMSSWGHDLCGVGGFSTSWAHTPDQAGRGN